MTLPKKNEIKKTVPRSLVDREREDHPSGPFILNTGPDYREMKRQKQIQQQAAPAVLSIADITKDVDSLRVFIREVVRKALNEVALNKPADRDTSNTLVDRMSGKTLESR